MITYTVQKATPQNQIRLTVERPTFSLSLERTPVTTSTLRVRLSAIYGRSCSRGPEKTYCHILIFSFALKHEKSSDFYYMQPSSPIGTAVFLIKAIFIRLRQDTPQLVGAKRRFISLGRIYPPQLWRTCPPEPWRRPRPAGLRGSFLQPLSFFH